MNNRPEYIVVARFGRPRGLTGEIYLEMLSDNPERFEKTNLFRIESAEGWTEIEIIATKMVSGRPVVNIKGVKTVEEVKPFAGELLYISADELGTLPEGQYYYFDLIGCKVTDTKGNDLGRILNIENYPANEVWVIITPEKKQCLFPAVKDFVEKVDIENKVVIIDPPEGIFDSPDEN